MRSRSLVILSLCMVLCSCSAGSDTNAADASDTSVSAVSSETVSSVEETTSLGSVTETAPVTSPETTAAETHSEAVSEESYTETSEESTYPDTAVSDRITEVTLGSEEIVIETTVSRAAPEDFTGSFYMYLENYSADPEFWSFYIECLDGDAPVNAARDFTAERLENGEWVNVPLFVPDVFLESSLLGIVVGKEPPALHISISDIDFAEPLESGHYRITVIDTNGVFNGENVSCEFDVP